ncbi:MAG TPA: alpha/beta fold hydrolase [Anaerolineales bacterium]|nr:alpha/beta fold hydrolase [Anaerolineales bacterium]
MSSIGLLLIVYGALPTIRAVAVAHPAHKPVCCKTPADFGLKYEDVSFQTKNDLTLRGWYIPGKNRAAVIITHGFGGNRADYLEPAAVLVQHNFSVLSIDLIAHGDSEGDVLTLNGEDVLAAVAFLKSQTEVDSSRIGVWGFSLGGLVSIQAAAQSNEIQAVAADGPFPVVTTEDMPPPEHITDLLWIPFDWMQHNALALQGVSAKYSTIEALHRITPRPVLLVAGIQNNGERRVLEQYYTKANQTVTLWEIPEAGHVGGWWARPQEYAQRIIKFFEQALLGNK